MTSKDFLDLHGDYLYKLLFREEDYWRSKIDQLEFEGGTPPPNWEREFDDTQLALVDLREVLDETTY